MLKKIRKLVESIQSLVMTVQNGDCFCEALLFDVKSLMQGWIQFKLF
jgi:hypothetical protein